MSEESFYRCNQKSRHGKPTIAWRCKECLKDRRKARYRANPQANNAATNAWRRANPESARATVTRSYEKNKSKYLPRYKAKRTELRVVVLRRYAPEGSLKCDLCSESHHELLVLDHIDGGGTEHRKETGGGDKFYRWIKANSYPVGYRVLCHNCNFKEHLRQNRENFDSKVWNRTNSSKIRVINGKEYQINLRKAAMAEAAYKSAVKLECLVRYSSILPTCACCQIEDQEILSIDHVGGGGRKHRKETGDGINFYQWLRRNNFPSDYRVLCLNCNFAYGLRGICPHRSDI